MLIKTVHNDVMVRHYVTSVISATSQPLLSLFIFHLIWNNGKQALKGRQVEQIGVCTTYTNLCQKSNLMYASYLTENG